jgi:RNA polymerase sigma-70 factor (ECF subfamily)
MSGRSFEETVLPHLDAAFNYARWLTRSDVEAEEVVQDAYVRALRFFSTLRGEDARPWLLAIVRNTYYARGPRHVEVFTPLPPDEWHAPADGDLNPEALVIRQETVKQVHDALERLPVDFREAIVLRELEGLSYREIAAVTGVPIGTVMSRLARARERLLGILAAVVEEGVRS